MSFFLIVTQQQQLHADKWNTVSQARIKHPCVTVCVCVRD